LVGRREDKERATGKCAERAGLKTEDVLDEGATIN
jgi:hypothetical protein